MRRWLAVGFWLACLCAITGYAAWALITQIPPAWLRVGFALLLTINVTGVTFIVLVARRDYRERRAR